MNIKVLKTEEDYSKALTRFDKIFDAPANSVEGEEAELISLLIEKYEDEHYPIDPPDPIEAIKFRMEQTNLNNKDLAELIGYKNRMSELINRKKKLTLTMIRRLHDKLRIPYEILMVKY